MAQPPIPGWKSLLAQRLAVPDTPQNETFFTDWQRAEGGGALNDPFNTTLHTAGSTGSYNRVGVQNYATPQAGLDATAATLKNGHYDNILAALRQGTSASAAAQALAQSPWGTGSLVEKILGATPATQLSTGPTSSPQLAAGPSTTPRQIDFAPKLGAELQAASGGGDYSQFYATLGQALRQRTQPQAAPSAGAPARTVQTAAAPQVAGNGVGSKIAQTALTQLGTPYQWGGTAKLGSRTDCSGLLQASAAANGVNIGRTTYEQYKQGTPVPLTHLQPGDAVFFEPGSKGPEHVAIYIGGGRVVEDPHTGASVEISQLAGRGPVGARRYA